MPITDESVEGKGASGRLRRYVPLAVALVAIGAFFATGLYRTLSFGSLVRHHAWIQHMVAERHLSMLGLYIVIYVALVTLSIPASAFMMTLGGYLFGWAIGGGVAAVAATLGATGIFLIARTSLGRGLLRRAGGRIQALAAGFRKEAFSYLLFLRLLPVMPFWITNLAAALFDVRLTTFMLATQIGVVPVSFAFAFAGSGLDDVVASQERAYRQCLASGSASCSLDFEPGDLLTPELVAGLAVLGILALAPIMVRRWNGRRREEQA